MAQLRNKIQLQKNGTTAKLYVGIIQEISTTAKKWHNCETKCTTAKKAQLQYTFIAVVHFLAITTFPYSYT